MVVPRRRKHHLLHRHHKIYEEKRPVCLDTLPVDLRTASCMLCCGKAMHTSCKADMRKSTMSSEQKNACPLCRTRSPTTDKERLKLLRKFVNKGAAWAQSTLASQYRLGCLGLTQSYAKAIQLRKMAMAQGNPQATFDSGVTYDQGHGVDQSYERAVELYSMAQPIWDIPVLRIIWVICTTTDLGLNNPFKEQLNC